MQVQAGIFRAYHNDPWAEDPRRLLAGVYVFDSGTVPSSNKIHVRNEAIAEFWPGSITVIFLLLFSATSPQSSRCRLGFPIQAPVLNRSSKVLSARLQFVAYSQGMSVKNAGSTSRATLQLVSD